MKIDLSAVCKLVEKLQLTLGTNDKVALMKQFEDPELLKKVLKYTYQDSFIYGIKSSGIEKIRKKRAMQSDSCSHVAQKSLFGGTPKSLELFDLLDELNKHPYGADKDIDLIVASTREYEGVEFELILNIIQKDLHIKCGAKLINKAFPGLIEVFEVMLAFLNSKYPDYIGNKLGMLQRKLDGYRCVAQVEACGSDIKVTLTTRNGIHMLGFDEIERDVALLYKFSGCKGRIYYDGEITGNAGEFTDVQKLAFRAGVKTGVTYNIFDVISAKEFEDNENTQVVRESAFDRSNNLCTMFERYLNSNLVQYRPTSICYVPNLYVGEDCESKIPDMYANAISNGWEGLIWKNANAPYQRKRTKDMLKFKEELSIDLRVVRLEEGTKGKDYEGMLGSAIVSYKGYEVGVSSGFSLAQRKHIWEHPEDLVGKIIEVHYQNTTTNDNGTESLRIPRFISVRMDKTDPDA